MGDAAQVLDVMREALTQHMQAGLPDYQIVRTVVIGRNSGKLLTDDDVIDGHDVPGGLRITMRSGAEYELTLREVV